MHTAAAAHSSTPTFITFFTLLILALILLVHPARAEVNTANIKLINNTGKEIGYVYLKQGTEGVVMRIHANHLSPGVHGMHFHKVGDCSDHRHFYTAKGHIMPTGKPHGLLHPQGPHAGNLPNIIVHEDGSVDVELYTELVSLSGQKGKPALLDSDGSTLIIHEYEDDHFSQPIGGSGGRIACGVVE